MRLTDFDEVIASLCRGYAVRLNSSQSHTLIAQFPAASPFLLADDNAFTLDVLPDSTTKDTISVSTKATPADMRSESAKIFSSLLTRLDVLSHRKSAVAVLLRQRALDNANHLSHDELKDLDEKAQMLDDCVTRWHAQRLWSINLAPELVAHDERHVASVESLLASLIEPFWLRRSAYDCSFTADELVWLSIAAWLHDWGHVGGPIRPYKLGSDPIFLSHTMDVRELHGVISQCLLSEQSKGMHGLEQYAAAPAAILCAHHQGKTSFDDAVPKTPEAMQRLRLGDLRSLREDWNALSADVKSSLTFQRLQFLVALLRVADGADLGCHRVADGGIARGSFLGRCLYRETLRTMELAEFSTSIKGNRKVIAQAARELVVVALSAGESGDETDLSQFTVETHGEPLLEKLDQYRNFLIEQFTYYDKHALVRTVHFEFTPTGRFNAIVCPTHESHETDKALNTVAEHIDKELSGSKVRAVLRAHGFIFRYVRTPDWVEEQGERPIDGAFNNES